MDSNGITQHTHCATIHFSNNLLPKYMLSKGCRHFENSYFSFNKKEEDFETLREYNDYLEMLETISKYSKTLIYKTLIIHSTE